MKKLISILLCLIIMIPSALAASVNGGVSDKLADTFDTGGLQKAVPREARQGVRNMSPSDSDFPTGLGNVLQMALDALGINIKQSLKTFLLIVVCALIMGIAGSTGSAEKPLLLAGVLSVAAICFSDVKSLFGLMSQTITQIDSFSKMLLPALTAASAAAGAPVGATARNAATVLFSDVLITAIDRFMMPCTYAYLALVTADAAIGNNALKGLADFLKSGLSGILKILITLFVAYLTITGVISGTNDVILEKSTKLAISGMIPVVGGIVSEATQTIVAGAGILRNSIGIFGLIAVLSITIAPIIRLGLNFLMFKLASAVSSAAAPPAIMQYIGTVAQVYSLMLGMICAAAVMLLIGIISCMQAGLGV